MESRKRATGARVRRYECGNLHRWSTVDLGDGEFADRRTRSRGNAKLTPEQIQAIRADGRPQTVIAAEYGISQTRVSEIRAQQEEPTNG